MKPRVLVVEDDPVSRAFFRAALTGLPAVVDAAADCGEAEACVRGHAHALWLVDAHLPDGTAVELLPRLRLVRGATAPDGAVAIAHTASRDPGVHGSLLGAGFVDVLVKPVAAASLLASARRCLRLQVRETRAMFAALPCPAAIDRARPGPWDDAAAQVALGGAADIAALRGLFVDELPALLAHVDAALQAGDAGAVRALLHRLASACAFTGAADLGQAVRRLHRAPSDRRAETAFRHAAARLLSPPADL